MKLAIDSDFREWYDHVFYNKREADICIPRNTWDSKHRKSDLEVLHHYGFTVPNNGTVQELFDKGCEVVVCYTDPYAHKGEGKKLIYKDWNYSTQDSECFATEFISNNWESTRYLQIGNRAWMINYKQNDLMEFRSNVGEKVQVKITSEVPLLNNKIAMTKCIFAIDFVFDDVRMYAIDLNTAPGTKFTGLSDIVSATDIYQSCLDWQLL